jgi:hypothetical protein
MLEEEWRTDEQDIGWAEAIGFELLVCAVTQLHSDLWHLIVYRDNKGVVEGWWRGCSHNRQVNLVFRRINTMENRTNTSIYTRYVASANNPADV